MLIIPNTLMMLMEIDYLSTMGTSVIDTACDAGDYMSFDFTEDAKHMYISVLNSTTYSMNGLHQYSFDSQQLTSISDEKGSVRRGFNNHMYIAPVNFDYIVDITTEKRILIESGATSSGLLAVQPYKVVESVKSRNEILAQRFIDRKSYKLKDHLGNVNSVLSDLKTSIIESDGKPSLFETKLNSLTNYYPFGMLMPGRNYSSSSYRFGFGGVHEKDDEWRGITGADYDFGGYGYDALTGRRKSPDPHQKKYPSISPYASFNNNPIIFVDIDGRDVFPTNELKANKSANTILTLASKNSVFKNVMKSFYANQNHVYVHLAQLKDNSGNPSGFTNTARTQSYKSVNNPVGKYGIHRIVINSDILASDGTLKMDKTVVFGALLHEGIHARMYEGHKQDGTLKGYPGHSDFLTRGGEGHHNQMGAFNRQELIDGMKEFDTQL